jgi:Zn-dependent peptidase ImmA (M78 family)
VRQGEQVAVQERKRLGLGQTPVADMGELISDQGIWSSGVHLPHEMSGLFLHHPSIGLTILVNFSHVRGRKRFSYAHEYAHALLDRERTATVSTRDNASELIEKRANAFAAALLMPGDGVTEFLRTLDKGLPSRLEQAIFDVATEGRIDTQTRPTPGSQAITHQDLALLAHHFGVSYQAAVYRLKSLNWVSSSECAKLLEREPEGKSYLDFLKMLDDLDAPETQERQERELKSQVVHLAIEAYRREVISRGKLLDLSKKLALSGRKLIELAEAVKED